MAPIMSLQQAPKLQVFREAETLPKKLAVQQNAKLRAKDQEVLCHVKANPLAREVVLLI